MYNPKSIEESLLKFRCMLEDPQYLMLGQTFVSDVKYAIYLLEKYRDEQEEIIAQNGVLQKLG